MKTKFLISMLMLNSVFAVHAAETWTPQTCGTKANLTSISCPDANTCYAVGDSSVILKTSNGGSTWVKQANPEQANPNLFKLRSVFFFDLNNGQAVGNSQKGMKTTNGGVTWDTIRDGQGCSGCYNDDSYRFQTALQFLNSKTGYKLSIATAYKGGANPPWWLEDSCFFHATTDGGITWKHVPVTSSLNPPLNDTVPYDLCFVDSLVGYILSANIISKTVNGGQSWTSISTTSSFLSLRFVNRDTGYAVGRNPRIAKSTNGGALWNSQSSTTFKLRSVRFVDASIGYAVGDTGTILGTVNGGTTWTPRISGTTGNLNAMTLVANGAMGYAVGAGGTILKMTGGTPGAAILELKSSNGHLGLHYIGNPWYGFVLPDNRVFNLLGRQPVQKSISLPVK